MSTLLYKDHSVASSGAAATLLVVADSTERHRKSAGDVIAAIVAASLGNKKRNGDPVSVRDFTSCNATTVTYVDTHRSVEEYGSVKEKANRRARFFIDGFSHRSWVNHPDSKLYPSSPDRLRNFVLSRVGSCDVLIVDSIGDIVQSGAELQEFLKRLQELSGNPAVILPVYAERDAALLQAYAPEAKAVMRMYPKGKTWRISLG